MAMSSGFWETYGGINAGATYALYFDRPAKIRRLGLILNSLAMIAFKERFDAAIDASTGEATVQTYSRVAHTPDPGNPAVHGGAVTIESVNVMDSATITAAEEAEILASAQLNTGHNLPVEDSSGNGGGGKLGLL